MRPANLNLIRRLSSWQRPGLSITVTTARDKRVDPLQTFHAVRHFSSGDVGAQMGDCARAQQSCRLFI